MKIYTWLCTHVTLDYVCGANTIRSRYLPWHARLKSDLERCGYFPGKRLRADAPLLYLIAPALRIHPATEACPALCVARKWTDLDRAWTNAGERKIRICLPQAPRKMMRREIGVTAATTDRISSRFVDRERVDTSYEEFFDRFDDRWPGLGFVNCFAQSRAAGNSVREPGSELLHLAGRVGKFLIKQHGKIGANQVIAIQFRGLCRFRLAVRSAILTKDPRI